MKNSIICFLLFLSVNLFSQTSKVYDDFHYIPVFDSVGGMLVYKTNTVISQIVENGRLLEIEGDLVNTIITIDTSFTSIQIVEDGVKKKYTLEIDSILNYDLSFTENDTLFKLIDKDFFFSMNNGYKLHLRFTNDKCSFIKVLEDNYIVDYSFVKPEDVDRFFTTIEYNREVIYNNKKER